MKSIRLSLQDSATRFFEYLAEIQSDRLLSVYFLTYSIYYFLQTFYFHRILPPEETEDLMISLFLIETNLRIIKRDLTVISAKIPGKCKCFPVFVKK